ncbi:sulfotransferase [Streptomyces sp. LE64]|uniref:sulfotransferase n=1 Tax=Streptomyces sp. LE64 TaxID=3448653 RepID=UPI0040430AD8
MTLHAPAATGLRPDLTERLAVARGLCPRATADLTGEIRDVVVLASSSRGGSSMVAETLRASRDLLHLQGEINPFLRITGLAHPDSGDCDRLDAEHLAGLDPALREVLDTELAHDIGSAADPAHAVDDRRYAADLAARLVMQWPELPVEPGRVAETAERVLAAQRAGLRGPQDPPFDAHRFFPAFFAELADRGLPVEPGYYDLPRGLVRPEVPGPGPAGPPGGFLVEEPPFILPRPWCPASPQDARTKPLVVKTPSNAYRFGFLRALFPHARFRVVHLTRNPAAAVNGLWDGWLHHGFHAHRMTRPLGIGGYVERAPDNRWWWKFDLAPGWQEFTSAPLLDVCAFQWRSAHQAVLDELAGGEVERLTLRFEDLIGGAAGRIDCFERLADWLGVPFEGAFRRAAHEGIGPVVATAEPRAGRWRARAARISAAVGPADRALADRLGYTDETEWI